MRVKRRNPVSNTMGMPVMKPTIQLTMVVNIRRFLSDGNWSLMEPMRTSHVPQTDEMANRTSMKKKRKEKRGGQNSMAVKASG